MTLPTNSDTLEPADLLLIGLPFMNDAWAKFPNDREHMKQAFKASEGYKQALAALTEREERIKREKYIETLQNLAGRGYITFEQQKYLLENDREPMIVEFSELTKETGSK